MTRMQTKRMFAAVAGLVMVLAGCGTSSTTSTGGSLTIAVKNFSENSIMGTMTKLLLQQHGYTVTIKEIAGNASIRDGLTSKQYDGYWEYLGTGLVDVNNITDAGIIGDPLKAVDKLNQLDSAKGIVWLPPATRFNDPDVLVVRSADTGTLGSTMSQLAVYLKAHGAGKVCVQPEFKTRTAGWPALVTVYGFPSADTLPPPEKESIALQDVANHPDRCQVGQGFGTDANIAALNEVIVKDDKKALPSDSFSLTLLKSVSDAHPDLKDLIKKITDVFTTQDSIDLQNKIDVQKVDETVIVQRYLKAKGIIS